MSDIKLMKVVNKKEVEIFDDDYIKRQKVTVGDFLKFVEQNKIPLDSEILVEHLDNYYLDESGWRFFNVYDELHAGPDGSPARFNFIHNGIGYIRDKEYLTLNMHY